LNRSFYQKARRENTTKVKNVEKCIWDFEGFA
jgi:hypothetical protein